MIIRTFVTALYLAAVATAVVLQYFIPAIGVFLLYGLLGWFMISMFLYRLPVMSRPLFGRAGAASPPAPSSVGVPLTSNPGGTPLSFCAFCAAPVDSGTPVCPSCGHAIPAF